MGKAHCIYLPESWSNSRLPTPEPPELPKGMQATGVHRARKVKTGICRNSVGPILSTGHREAGKSAETGSPLHHKRLQD